MNIYIIVNSKDGWRVQNARTKRFTSKKFFKYYDQAEKHRFAIQQAESDKLTHRPPYKKFIF